MLSLPNHLGEAMTQLLNPTRRKTLACGLMLAVCFTATSAHASRLDDIKSRGKLICATLSGSEPLAYQDPQTRQYVGFDVDTCAALAKRMGVALEHRPITVEARIPELGLGRVDVVAAAMGYTK